ncbi:MAG: hypothetical protein HY813_01230 [Candidatus Portnoybacteria bacterium]|nr:hypothetical protein [Candidatus Portnoybacteria bacterium]
MEKIKSHYKKHPYSSALISILLFFVLYFLGISYFYPALLDRASFGDMFGGIKALFSGFAFLGIIYAIILQREELRLQRKEFELTRKELKRTAEAQEKSEKALSKQAESLKITAKLNGLSSVLQYNIGMIDTLATGRYGSGGIDKNLKQECEDIKQKIEDIINDK